NHGRRRGQGRILARKHFTTRRRGTLERVRRGRSELRQQRLSEYDHRRSCESRNGTDDFRDNRQQRQTPDAPGDGPGFGGRGGQWPDRSECGDESRRKSRRSAQRRARLARNQGPGNGQGNSKDEFGGGGGSRYRRG